MARLRASEKRLNIHFDQTDSSAAPRVLIIDDKKTDAKVLTRALTDSSNIFAGAHIDVKTITNPAKISRFLVEGLIDIFIVDLKLKKSPTSGEDIELGRKLVRQISESTLAGIIVYSSEPIGRESPESLVEGADDYIEKGTPPRIIKTRVFALWRRVQRLRPSLISAFVHTNRIFQIGRWRFVIGSRDLLNEAGERIRISPTEHAFLSHIVTVEDHEIDREYFNAYVLGRETYHDDRRLDNLVSRLRSKLGDTLQLISNRKNGYTLVSVTEIGK